MTDPVQQALQNFALSGSLPKELAILSGAYLVFALAAGWVAAVAWRRESISIATIARVALLVVVSFIVAKALGHIVSDPRPYIVAHTQPLAPVTADNGFPSDHTLMAAALTASLWWIARKLIPIFAIGTLLVAAGRLAIEAHHLEDVLGSMAIVLVVMLVVNLLPLPATWGRPILASAKQPQRAA